MHYVNSHAAFPLVSKLTKVIYDKYLEIIFSKQVRE